MQSKFLEITFSDADVVNPGDFIPAGEYNPHIVRPFLMHDHGFTIAVVFASNLQDALDEAADNDKLDRYQIDLSDASVRDDYMSRDVPNSPDADVPDFVDSEGGKWSWQESREPAFLGNAGEPFDIEGLDAIELPNPAFSFCALFNAQQEGRR
jgi:hypothetical protein